MHFPVVLRFRSAVRPCTAKWSWVFLVWNPFESTSQGASHIWSLFATCSKATGTGWHFVTSFGSHENGLMGGARIRLYLAQWGESQQERMRCHICGPSLGHRQNCAQWRRRWVHWTYPWPEFARMRASQTWPHVGDKHPQSLFDRYCLAIWWTSSGHVFFESSFSLIFHKIYWIKLDIWLNAIVAQIITSILSTDFLEQAQKSCSFNSIHVPVVTNPNFFAWISTAVCTDKISVFRHWQCPALSFLHCAGLFRTDFDFDFASD